MTIDEARRILGIDAAATAEDLRRAYTRGIKQHKPDKDPEGFRRVREAYELLKSSTDASAAITAMFAEAKTAAPRADAPPPTPEQAAMQAEREALIARIGDARDPEFVLARIVAHLEDHPRDDRARMIAIEECEALGRELDALKLAREGAEHARTPLLFVRELTQRNPRELAPAQIEALVADAASAPWAVAGLSAQGRLEEAQTLAFASLEQARGASVDLRAAWLRTIASMYESGAAPLARALMRELDRRVPDDVTRDGDPTRIPTLLLRELGDVAGEIDRDLVRALGAFIAAPSRGSAMLTAFPDDAKPLVASKRVLEARAPMLTRLAFPEARRRGGFFASLADSPLARRVIVALVAFVIFPLIRQATWHVGPSPRQVLPAMPAIASAQRTREGARLCADYGAGSATCGHVHAAEDAADGLDCARATEEADALVRDVVADTSAPAERALLARALRAHVSDRCAGVARTDGGSP